MDHVNYFDTKTTYRLVRAEYLAGFVACAALLVVNHDEVRWWVAVALFFAIDAIGYWPGAVAFRLAKARPISKLFYVLYNTMHNWFTVALICGAWAYFAGVEWALVAVPLHLCADRGLLGNFLKPFSVSFEPAPLAAYQVFAAEVAEDDRPAGQRRTPEVAAS